MKDLVEYIAKNLVSDKDAVLVEEVAASDGVVELKLTVNPKDMGIIIGRSGQMIKAIRRLLAVRAMTDNVRVDLQLNEPETR